MVGLIIAPNSVSYLNSVLSLIAVALGAGAAGTLNMWYESDLDALMTRTCLRPIPTGQVTKNQALFFGVFLSIGSISLLYFSSNSMSAFLLFLTIISNGDIEIILAFDKFLIKLFDEYLFIKKP